MLVVWTGWNCDAAVTQFSYRNISAKFDYTKQKYWK